VFFRSYPQLYSKGKINNLVSKSEYSGSSYWNFAFVGAPGDVLKDEEGIGTMRTLGENMAWLMKKLG
jgi:hypothetical protein